MPSKTVPPALTDQELVQLALNEQGFLFQQRVVSEIHAQSTGTLGDFRVRATEYPVSIANGLETKIDAVLTDGSGNRAIWHLVIECKRSNPLYKRWVFFEPATEAASYCIEKAALSGSWNHQGEPPMMHYIDRIPADKECPQFSFYLEAMLERPNSQKRASATDAIEDALQQVTLGCAGLSRRLRETHLLHFHIVPVVVTTAEIVVAKFLGKSVSLDRGMIAVDQLKLSQQKWLAVDFRTNDSLARSVKLSSNSQSDVADDLLSRHQRTVFVVQARNISAFIGWFSDTVSHRKA